MLYWTLFVIASAIAEASIFDQYSRIRTARIDVHVWLHLMRLTVLIGMFPYEHLWLYLLVCAFTFPLIHDGVYYLTRHLMNDMVYPRHFFDHSTTTSAVFSFPFATRVVLFGCGVIYYIALA